MTVCSSAIPNWIFMVVAIFLIGGTIAVMIHKMKKWKKVGCITIVILLSIAGLIVAEIMFNTCRGLTKEWTVKDFNTEVTSSDHAEQLLKDYLIEETKSNSQIAAHLTNRTVKLNIIINEETYSTFFLGYVYTIDKNGKIMKSWAGD